MEIQVLLPKYGEGYQRLTEQLTQFPEEAIHFKPSPDKWSIAEIICHIADAEANAYVRLRKAIAESGGEIAPYDHNAWAENLFYDKLDYKDALELIRILRKNMYEVLKLVPEEQWLNYFMHPETGRITLKDGVQLYVEHIEMHIQQMHRNFYDWTKANEKVAD